MHKYLTALAKELDPVTVIVTATVLGVRKQQIHVLAGQQASVASITEKRNLQPGKPK